MKHCNSCDQTKQDFEFYKSAGSKCVDCYRAYCRKRLEKIKDGTYQPKTNDYNPSSETKVCKECLQTLTVNNFYRDKVKGYYSSKCKTCNSYDRMNQRVKKGHIPREYERSGMYSVEFRQEVLQLHNVMEEIRTGKIKHDPVEHEEFCKQHKILHHREWVFSPQRLIEIENELTDENEDVKIERKRKRLQREGIDVDNMNDDEILNYLNL